MLAPLNTGTYLSTNPQTRSPDYMPNCTQIKKTWLVLSDQWLQTWMLNELYNDDWAEKMSTSMYSFLIFLCGFIIHCLFSYQLKSKNTPNYMITGSQMWELCTFLVIQNKISDESPWSLGFDIYTI